MLLFFSDSVSYILVEEMISTRDVSMQSNFW